MALFLSLIVIGLAVWGPLRVSAADQNAAILQAIQGLQASVNDLSKRVITLSADVKNDRALMLKKTDAAQADAGRALDGVAAADAGHEASLIVGQDTRLSRIETLFQEQKDREKASSDAAMTWLHVLAAAVLPAMLGLLGGFFVHKRNMEIKMAKVEKDVARTEKNTNSLTEKLVKAEKIVSHTEGMSEGHAEGLEEGRAESR